MDYPERARRLDEEGVVVLSYSIAKDGKISGCAIEESSGFDELDLASCTNAKGWRFSTDGDPKYYNVRFHQRIAWKLEKSGESLGKHDTYPNIPAKLPSSTRGVNIAKVGDLPAGKRANVALYLTVETDGSVSTCRVAWGTGNSELDKRTCAVASEWRYRPALKNGTPIKSVSMQTFRWAAPDAPAATPSENEHFLDDDV